MLFKLEFFIEEYENLTLRQKSAIDSNDIDLLNNLIDAKSEVIQKLQECLNGDMLISISDELRDRILNVIALEKQNITSLNVGQKSIRENITNIKKKQNAYKGYAKNIHD